MTSFFFSFLAGILTAFSPCVLPALPLIVGSASQEHKLAPLFLAFGLVVSFTGIGVLLASSGSVFGFDGNNIRVISASAFVLIGLILVVPRLQSFVQSALQPIANFGNHKLAKFQFRGIGGQFFLGILLGSVWSPCVGPTLGAAISLASQGQQLVFATITMLVFSIGASTPLLFLAYGSRKIFLSRRPQALQFGRAGKYVMGSLLLVVGTAILFGWDKGIEAKLLEWLPDQWVHWISYF